MSLDHANFSSPPADCTPIPFWFLNGVVDGTEYCRQIDEMAKQGVRQAMPHPRFGMDRRDYLTDRYWQAMKQLAEHAAQTGTILHLYDEFNWSSGPAGGKVTADRSLCALGLAMRSQRVQTAANETNIVLNGWLDGFCGWGEKEKLLAVCYAPILSDGELNLSDCRQLPLPAEFPDELTLTIPAGNWEAMAFYTVRTIHPSPLRQGNGGIIDYLAPAPTARFIELTHEQYYRHLGKYFGKSIPSMFYDESGPYSCGSFTWTQRFPDYFRAQKGYDLLPLLPLLFFPGGALTEKTRGDYWDVLTHLFTEHHIGQMADWCAAHGLLLTGHTYEEPERWMVAGDAFQTLRRQQWPGFDNLGGRKPYHFIKPAAGVAHVGGNQRQLLCESMGLLGIAGEWRASPRLIRSACNQLAIVGVTHQVPHAFFQTLDNPKVECPPSFFEHNPYWRHFSGVAALLARLCWLNRQGAHVTELAVFWPVVSWWGTAAGGRGTGYPWQIKTELTEGSRADRLVFEELIDCLMAAQRDHDVIDGQALGEGVIADGRLRVSEESYSALIVPPLKLARRTDLRRMLDFARAGGTLIVLGGWPVATLEDGRNDPELPGLLRELQAVALPCASVMQALQLLEGRVAREAELLGGANGDVVEISHRRDSDSDLFLINHAGESEATLRFWLNASGCATLFDPATGDTSPLPTRAERSGTTISLRFEPDELLAVCISRTTATQPATELPSHRVAAPAATMPDMLKEASWSFLPVPAEWGSPEAFATDPCIEAEIAVPVAYTRELHTQTDLIEDQQLWQKWFRPDYSATGWELVHSTRGALLYSCEGSRLFRIPVPAGAHALRLPLPIEKEYALYYNGELLKTEHGHDVTGAGWLTLPGGGAGPDGGLLAIECASMAADFGLTGAFVFRCKESVIPLRSWTENGLWWHSGEGRYRTSFTLNELPSTCYLDLGEVRECAQVWINGQCVGARLWPPYRVEIARFLRPGRNEITVLAANLIANRMHWDRLGGRGNGCILPSGLLGPVSLHVAACP